MKINIKFVLYLKLILLSSRAKKFERENSSGTQTPQSRVSVKKLWIDFNFAAIRGYAASQFNNFAFPFLPNYWFQ